MANQEVSFGMWIRKRRKALDITQRELAQRVGCSDSLIFKIESDERRPSRQITELLAQHLEIPIEQRELFLKVGRQEKMVDHLEPISPAPVSQKIKTNLPLALTSFIGREHELHAIILQLQNPSCRLINLTGPGGVGKTRLALEVAQQLHDLFNYGACFVSLVGTSTSEFVIPAVADVLGFSFSGKIELKTQLFNFLKEKQILLVLDNLEHLLNGIELLDELLEFAPGVKLLTTSREQLNLRAEWAFEVQGLPIPSNIELDTLGSNNAGALFLQRARQVKMNFAPVQEDAPAIARICQLVEGLPLGLELAATWVSALSCRDIATEIERGLDFLATSKRNVPPRHRSIRAVFDHSWSLLTDEECQVMQQLSVFHGGFTRQAADVVAGATLLTLSALVDKSLVQRSEGGRYALHELIRQYAATILQAKAQEENVIHRKHAEYYLTLLQACGPALTSSFQKDAFAELNTDIDNLRAAWESAIVYEEVNLIRKAAFPYWYFHNLRDSLHEGETAFARAVDRVRAHQAHIKQEDSAQESNLLKGVLGELLSHQGQFTFRQGRIADAAALYQSSLVLLRPLDELTPLVQALTYSGVVHWISGEFDKAWLHLNEGLSILSKVDDEWLQAQSRIFIGMVAYAQGDYAGAYRYLSDSVSRARVLGDPRILSLVIGQLGRAAQASGKTSEVLELLQESLMLTSETGDRLGLGITLEQLAVVAQASGDEKEARRLLKESIKHFRDIGDTWFMAHALNLDGYFALAMGDETQAQESFKQAGKIAHENEAPPNILDALAGLGTLYAHQGIREMALRITLYILQHPAGTKETKDKVEKLRSEMESQLAPEQIEAARSYAYSTSLDAIARELLS
jgi:predicted ATPase/DNA-binding XRE family transcriptional regulator